MTYTAIRTSAIIILYFANDIIVGVSYIVLYSMYSSWNNARDAIGFVHTDVPTT